MSIQTNQFLLRTGATLILVLVSALSAFAQTTVTGTVKDAAGQPVIGASVFVKGTRNGTVAAHDGSFSLPGARRGDAIEVSCIGYIPQTFTWNGQPLDVVLAEDSEMLEGTVITALGIRKDEKRVGYAVSSVNSDRLNATASPSLGSALYGKAAGVRVTTAPGGSTGAISINVRGLSSITGTNQPLIIVDGVPVRNGEANNSGYWTDQRVNSNGLTDINVEDIENLTVLKGASATSLYGSEGANGVVLITMKQGKKNTGIHVDLNASVQADLVAYMPTYQTTFGPGYPFEYWSYANLVTDPASKNFGFYEGQKDRDGNATISAQNSYYYFGPKYDGRQVYTPTGYRAFNPVSSNPWSDVFRTGITQQYNVAISNGGEHGHFRFSYTFQDNVPNQYNSHLGKHNFQLSGSQDITRSVKLGYSVSYMNQHIKNRPYRTYRLVSNYSGMFGAFDDIKYYREHTVTSAGYFNRAWSASNHENPAEGWEYNPAIGSLLSEYFWNILGKEQLEDNNRLIASVSPSWEIVKGLTVKGNIATDYTGQRIENRNHTETSTAFGSLSGSYSLSNRTFETLYGDVLANYSTQLTKDLGLDVNAGYSARRERALYSSVWTKDGLTVENWFHLNASRGTPGASMYKSDFLKHAYYATASLSWKDWAYLEGTIRGERASTMKDRTYWYPSVNASVIFSDLLHLPAWVDYGKIRASYGVVGNAPPLYSAPMAYNQSSASGYVYNQIPGDVGNDGIAPEVTHEWEFGLEGKLFHNRAGFELSYYTKRIVDQILQTTAPMSSGASSILMNVGELKNQGVEFSAYGTLIQKGDWRLDLSGNIAWNRNEVVKLSEGLDRLEHARWDNGAAYLYSFVGERMGDIYAFAPQEDGKGNKIVDDSGYYLRTTEPVKVGNAMPDLTGGFALSLGWKRLTLDANFNFQIGGMIFNMPYQYMMGLGALKESMDHRDAAHGGISYYTDGDSNNIAFSGDAGPNGELVRHDGIILDGVTKDGARNTKIMSAEMILEETYGWGTSEPYYYSHAMFDNTYLKCRELTLTWSLPDKWVSPFKCNNLRLSVFARNPFYVYKNLPIFDAESTDGTSWTSQVCIEGSSNASRTFGFTLRANF